VNLLNRNAVYSYFLKNKNKIFPQEKIKVLEIKRISRYSLINNVFCILLLIDGKRKRVYIKQFSHEIKREGWNLPQKRILREYYSLKILNNFLNDQVPFPYLFDEKNNLLVLSDVKKEGHLLLDILKKGNFSLKIVKSLSTFLGEIHGRTCNLKHPVLDKEAGNLIIKFKSAGAKTILPKIVKEVTSESIRQKGCFVIGDFTVKNIFIEKKITRICDLELSMVYDGALDAGHILADYLIFTKLLGNSKKFPLIWEDFVENYLRVIYGFHKTRLGDLEKIKERIFKYMIILTLHRTDGLSQYRFLSEDLKKRIREEVCNFYMKGRLL